MKRVHADRQCARFFSGVQYVLDHDSPKETCEKHDPFAYAKGSWGESIALTGVTGNVYKDEI